MAATVAVLGPGGVGGLLAGLLAHAGHRVERLAGEETVETLRKEGITAELEAIGAAVLRAAERHSVDVPRTTALVAGLRTRS